MKTTQFICTIILLLTNTLFATPITDYDLENIQKQPIKQHILYETYTDADGGLTSVFGYQFDTYYAENNCFILAISGAVGGNRGGYGVAAFGLGRMVPILETMDWNIRMLAGSGGGGNLPAGGGIMWEIQTGILFHMSKTMSFTVNTGYLQYPSGTFQSPIVNMGVTLHSNHLFIPFEEG